GIRKKTGEFIIHNISNHDALYYCTSSFNWTTNLDLYDNYTCKSAGFFPTGHYCCSEDDDKEEFYNDKGGLGACFNKTFIPNSDVDAAFPPTLKAHQYSELFVFNGTLQGCAIKEKFAGASPSFYNKDPNKPYNGSFGRKSNDWLLDLKNFPDSKSSKNNVASKPALVFDNNYCSTVGPPSSPKKYFCSYLEKWVDGNGKNRTHLSYINWTADSQTMQRAECCEPKQCWNGTLCVDTFNDAAKPSISRDNKLFRCIHGSWDTPPVKYSWNKKYSGFCPAKTQCLVDPKGVSANNGLPQKYVSDSSHQSNPQCINNSQFISDFYCDNGNWTTRTKFLASQLLGFAGSDFTLHCGSYYLALNKYDYTLHPDGTYTHPRQDCRDLGTDEAIIYQVYFGKLQKPGCVTNCTGNCTANFCVLNSNGKTLVGAVLNQQVDSQYYPFTDLLGNSISCPNHALDGNYHSCSTNRVWYNAKYQTVIFSNSEFNLGGSLFQQLQSWINSLITYLSGKGTLDRYPFITANPKLQNVYYDKHGSREVFALLENDVFVEGQPNQYISLTYQGFNTNICDAFNVSYYPQQENRYSCEKVGNNYRLVAETGSRVFEVWQDFTSKQRVR
ncbi:MAG: hypothetical protein V1837_07110, partial [Candidatus Woesearchaeota archaeon]